MIFSLSGKCPPQMDDVSSTLNNRFIMISDKDPSSSLANELPPQPEGCTADDIVLGCEKVENTFYVGGTNKLVLEHLPQHKHLGGTYRWTSEQDEYGYFLHPTKSPPLPTGHDHSNHHKKLAYTSWAIKKDNPNENRTRVLDRENGINYKYYPRYVRLRACVWGQ